MGPIEKVCPTPAGDKERPAGQITGAWIVDVWLSITNWARRSRAPAVTKQQVISSRIPAHHKPLQLEYDRVFACTSIPCHRGRSRLFLTELLFHLSSTF